MPWWKRVNAMPFTVTLLARASIPLGDPPGPTTPTHGLGELGLLLQPSMTIASVTLSAVAMGIVLPATAAANFTVSTPGLVAELACSTAARAVQFAPAVRHTPSVVSASPVSLPELTAKTAADATGASASATARPRTSATNRSAPMAHPNRAPATAGEIGATSARLGGGGVLRRAGRGRRPAARRPAGRPGR